MEKKFISKGLRINSPSALASLIEEQRSLYSWAEFNLSNMTVDQNGYYAILMYGYVYL